MGSKEDRKPLKPTQEMSRGAMGTTQAHSRDEQRSDGDHS